MPHKVFIAYSHDSAEHVAWVDRFARRLAAKGISVALDQWDLRPGANLHQYMERSVVAADRVLIVCTNAYVEKANDRTGGAGYEYHVITAAVARDQSTTKFVPIIRQSLGSRNVPLVLEGRLYLDLSDDEDFDLEIDSLVRDLYDRPRNPRPELGPNPFDTPTDSGPPLPSAPEVVGK